MFMYHRLLLNGATPIVKWGNGGRISVKDGTQSDNREFAVDHSQLSTALRILPCFSSHWTHFRPSRELGAVKWGLETMQLTTCADWLLLLR
jgi:hypothetical protein